MGNGTLVRASLLTHGISVNRNPDQQKALAETVSGVERAHTIYCMKLCIGNRAALPQYICGGWSLRLHVHGMLFQPLLNDVT